MGDEGELLGTDVGRALVGTALGTVVMRFIDSGQGVRGLVETQAHRMVVGSLVHEVVQNGRPEVQPTC